MKAELVPIDIENIDIENIDIENIDIEIPRLYYLNNYLKDDYYFGKGNCGDNELIWYALKSEFMDYDESGNLLRDIVFSESSNFILGTERDTFSVFQKILKEENADFHGEIKLYSNHEYIEINSIRTYKNGNFNGLVSLYYHPEGYGGIQDFIVMKGNMKDGLWDGVFEEFSESGKLASKSHYSKGEEHGLMEYYHENGNIEARGIFKEGKVEGEWIDYYPEGQINRRYFSIDGKIVGLMEIFYPSGNIKMHMHFNEDGNVIESIRYSEDGNVIETKHYDRKPK